MNVLNFLVSHLDIIIKCVGVIGGLIIAHVHLKSIRLQTCINAAVAFATQYAKVKAAGGVVIPNSALKQQAMDYVQARFPSVNMMELDADIEAAVAAWKAKTAVITVPTTARTATGQFAPKSPVPSATASAPTK